MILYRNSSFLGVRGCLLRNSRIPSPTASAVFLSADYPAGLPTGSAFRHFLALKPCAAQPFLQKLLHSFSAAYALIQRIAKQKIRRKIFAAAVADASTWLALRCEPKKSLHNLRA